MINLEELKLYLSVRRFDSTYIDGVQLYDEFLIHMTQLKKFIFNIKTEVYHRNVRFELPSIEDIQQSFNARDYSQVAVNVNNKSERCDGKCHIYSLPYEFEYFINLDNSFQGGVFHKVRQLTMNDSIPFDRQLFEIISRDFPFLEILSITNSYPQTHKQHSSIFITFPYLAFLDLKWAHVDYAEQFLVTKNMNLPRLLNLAVKYETLATITNNFTNDPKQFNFGKVNSLDVSESFVRKKEFSQYFPLL